jgi:putative membrane protein
MKFGTLIAIAGIATLPVAVLAQTTTAPEYVKKAGASDMYEKQSSQLVMKSKDAKIRSFAQMMIKDHTKSTADVKAAASKSGVRVPPPALEPKQASDVAALRAASGAERDRLYIEQQRMAHQEALMLHQTYAQSGDKPALQAVAGKITPVVQHHIEMLQGM